MCVSKYEKVLKLIFIFISNTPISYQIRYLKGIYPKAEEMLLLDILANADNNVQKASEKLQSMGYQKRDSTTPKLPTRGREEQNEQKERDKIEAENTPPPQPRLKSNEEKQKSAVCSWVFSFDRNFSSQSINRLLLCFVYKKIRHS